ncbi:MAG: hypothetical protein GY847_04385 [Proteobacteria bacterium]|nr:hypothetical protein [Pseudomonadota bacterium]
MFRKFDCHRMKIPITRVTLAVLVLAAALVTSNQSMATDDDGADPVPELCTITNGDFGNGLAGWSGRHNSVEDTANGYPSPSRHLDGFGATEIIYQTIELAPEAVTTVSVWGKSGSVGPQILDFIWIDIYDEPVSTWPPIHTGFWRVPQDDVWHKYSLTFTPVTGTHSLRLNVQTASDHPDPPEDSVYLLWFDTATVQCGPILSYHQHLPIIVK